MGLWGTGWKAGGKVPVQGTTFMLASQTADLYVRTYPTFPWEVSPPSY